MYSREAYEVLSNQLPRYSLLHDLCTDSNYAVKALEQNFLSKDDRKYVIERLCSYKADVNKLMKCKSLSAEERKRVINKVKNDPEAALNVLVNNRMKKEEKPIVVESILKDQNVIKRLLMNSKHKFDALDDNHKDMIIEAIIKNSDYCYEIAMECSRKEFYKQNDIFKAACSKGNRALDLFVKKQNTNPEIREYMLRRIAGFKTYLGQLLYNKQRLLSDDDKKIIISQIMETNNIETAAIAYQWMECTDEIKEQFEPMVLMVKLVKHAR